MHLVFGTGKVKDGNFSDFNFKTHKQLKFHFQLSVPKTAPITQLMTASKNATWNIPTAQKCAQTRN